MATDGVIEQGLAAALKLAAAQPWREVTLADIAAEAGLALADFHGVATREDIVEAMDSHFDKAMSADGVPEETSARERLFDVIMLRFEAMEPVRDGVKALMDFRMTSPHHLVRLPRHRHASASWALASAGLDDDSGAPLSLKRIAVAMVIAETERAWRRETSGDFALTMAALDKALRRAEDRMGLLSRVNRRRGTTKQEEPAT